MIKNGKLYVEPARDGADIKRIFAHLFAVGAGRQVDGDGYSAGPWTPELLVDAISLIDGNNAGIDLRTAQIWFQENDKGVSPANIRWLARVFGCDDTEATSDWQKELSAAQTRLTALRKDRNRADRDGALSVREEPVKAAPASKRRFSLARSSEAIFGRGSPLDLPASVFSGAVALGFISFLIGIHSATYERADGVIKQVGFIWAPNWTVLFMAFMPLFLANVVDLVVFWKKERRTLLQAENDNGWDRRVVASSYTYWAVLIICLPVAGLFQWLSVRLMPLIEGVDRTSTDWGSLAVSHPEIISVPEAIAFSALAYLYMSVCFYLFFVGLILLYTVTFDLWEIASKSNQPLDDDRQRQLTLAGFRVMRGVFRCSVLGLLIAICMKLESLYLSSSASDILSWLLADMASFIRGSESVSDDIIYSMPTHYSSLIIALVSCVVFVYGLVRLGSSSAINLSLGVMTAAIILLVAGYLTISSFSGFSVLLVAGCLFGIYGIFDPSFGTKQADNLGDDQNVS